MRASSSHRRRKLVAQDAITLKESGLTVYRPVRTAAIFAARRALTLEDIHLPGQWRGEGHHHAEAVSVITNTEVKDRPELLDIPYSDAQNEIYSQVPSLKRTFVANFVELRLLERVAGLTSDAIALIPSDETLQKLHEERQKCLEVLGGLAANGTYLRGWPHHIPHMSIMYVAHDVPLRQRQEAIECIADTLPQAVAMQPASIRHARRNIHSLQRAEYKFSSKPIVAL